MSASWYDVLGVAPDADAEEIKDAWRTSIADLDPTDRRFGLYNEAAGVLLDPARRAEYDAARDVQASTEPTSVEPTEPTSVEPVAEPEAGPEPDEGEPGDREQAAATAPRRTAPAVPGAVLLALALATLLAAGAAAYLQFGRTSNDDIESSLAEARAAAEAGLPKVFTYDHRFPERDHDQAARVLTGDLQEQYEQLWDDVIAPNLAKTEGTASSEVLGSGIVRAGEDGERAEIMVVLRSVTGNKEQTQQLTLALTATMVEQDGTWRIAELDGWDPEAVAGEEQPDADEGEGDDGSGGGSGGGSPSDAPSAD